MPSSLRRQVSFAPVSAHTTEASYPHSVSPPPNKRQKKMTITQTYRLAHSARGKLSTEAARGDHDLRLLVGHANLLDSLMLELQDAERDQEAWFNENVKTNTTEVTQDRHVQWRDTVVEEREVELDDADEESDSDSDSEYDEEEMAHAILRPRLRSPPAVVRSLDALNDIEEEDEDSDDDMYDDEDEDNFDLALVRTHSHSDGALSSPPELVSDSDESDEEDSGPSSPEQPSMEFVNAASMKTLNLKLQGQSASLVHDGELFPEHQPTMVAAC